jgi:hypothetical protein
MRGTWVSIRGHEIRSARLRSGEPVAVVAGEEVVVVGLSDEEYFGSWRGGRPEEGGPVTIGISYERVGEAVKEVGGGGRDCGGGEWPAAQRAARSHGTSQLWQLWQLWQL